MHFTASEISKLLGGIIEGNPEQIVSGFSRIEEGKEGDICFLANPKYTDYAYTTKASVLLVSHEFKPTSPLSQTLIRVDDVYSAVSILMDTYAAMQSIRSTTSIDKLASIDPSAIIGEGTTVGAFCSIGKHVKVGKNCIIYPQVFIDSNVSIGDNSILYPGVRIYRDCKIGQAVIIHSNTVIGSDGFGNAPQEDGSWKKIPQLGNVVIGDDVEIGANTCIDRATLGSTVIENGVRLDNLIQVAHNVRIGEFTAIAAQAGIAGSTKIGSRCLIGGQAGFVGHIQIANGTKIQAQSGVNRDIKTPNTAFYGSPAIAYNDFLRAYSVFRRLPELDKRLTAVEQKDKA